MLVLVEMFAPLRQAAPRLRCMFSTIRVVKPSPPSLAHKFDMDLYTGPNDRSNEDFIMSSAQKVPDVVANVKCVDSEALFRVSQNNPSKMNFNNPLFSVP